MHEPSSIEPHQGPTTLRHRLAQAIPPAKTAIAGALLWGCGMALSLFIGLEIAIEGRTSHRIVLLALYFAGGVLSFPLALYFVRFAARDRSAEIRFSAAFVSLTIATIGATAGLSAIVYWSISMDWSGNPLTTERMFQMSFAGAAALYQFAVTGTRYYLPLGIVLLFAASLWLARTPR